jgi:hypothetical protein
LLLSAIRFLRETILAVDFSKKEAEWAVEREETFRGLKDKIETPYSTHAKTYKGDEMWENP